MKDTKTQEQELIGPQKALQQYLDDLLLDATEHTESEADFEEDTESSEDVINDNPAEEKAGQERVSQEKAADQNEEGFFDQGSIEIDTISETESEMEALDLSFADFEAAIQPLQQEFESLNKQETAAVTIEDSSLASLGLTIGTPDLTDLEVSEDVEESVESAEIKSAEIAQAELSVDTDPVEAEAPALLQESEQIDSVEDDLDSSQIVETSEELQPKKQIAPTDPLPWAQSRFECLLFYVGKLKLAVPLVELGGIHQGSDETLTSIFGQPKWFLGMSNVGEFNLRTVDTAKWVMPDHYEGELKEHFKFVIQLDRSDWGLACESVAEAITLEPSEVKWRSDRSRRPWLAGTVIDHMCAILDVQGFITLLDDPENGFRKHLKHVD